LLIQCITIQVQSQDVDDSLDNLLEIVLNQGIDGQEDASYDISQIRSEIQNLYTYPININTEELDKLVELGILNYS
jgi:hypothetical protein